MLFLLTLAIWHLLSTVKVPEMHVRSTSCLHVRWNVEGAAMFAICPGRLQTRRQAVQMLLWPACQMLCLVAKVQPLMVWALICAIMARSCDLMGLCVLPRWPSLFRDPLVRRADLLAMRHAAGPDMLSRPAVRAAGPILQ